MDMTAILVMWPESFGQTFVTHLKEGPCKIWLWFDQWFLKRRCLKSVDDDDGWLTTEVCLYKLIEEPSVSYKFKDPYTLCLQIV